MTSKLTAHWTTHRGVGELVRDSYTGDYTYSSYEEVACSGEIISYIQRHETGVTVVVRCDNKLEAIDLSDIERIEDTK